MAGRDISALRALGWVEKGICYGSLSLLALIPFAEMILRRFSLAIPASKSIMVHLFLVLGFFASMLTVKFGEHISIAVIHYIKNDKAKQALEFSRTLLSVFILSVLAWNCISYIKHGLMGRSVGFIPERVFAAAMPLGYIVIALRFALKPQGKRERVMALAAILLGTVAALPAIAKIIWGFDPPEPFFSWVNSLYDIAWLIRLPAILFLILAALLGMPIFVAIGGIAMIALQAAGREPEAAPIQIFSALTEADIIAIPLFTLTGFFLSESNAGQRLVNAYRLFLGWLPGGMIITIIVICAFFSSFTGASGVTILALGGILYKMMNENRYPERFSIGLLTSAGGVGLMFPPSLPIILVGITSSTILHFMNVRTSYDIKHFFAGAIIPGLLLVLAMIATSLVLSSKVKVPRETFEPGKALRSLRESAFEILLPVILMLGYFTGLFTLVEASAVSVIYVVIVEVFIKKDIAVAEIPKVFLKAVPIIGGVLAILAMAKALSYAIIDSGIPENFTTWMQGAVQSKYVFLLLLNLALLVVGCLMDIFSAIMVVLPLIVPLGFAYGIDPVHLGIIFIMNLEVGFLTPPVGMNLFLASYRFEKPFAEICRCVLPYILIQFAVVLLVTYIPWLSTWLPGFFN
ncbi:MAG: TRAP transporter large permease subunit [Treponema sp.]|jgi:tripartite ATP-independent transporter DctM subunit|nr:TRAP transporter large permease subunit [Treponema sp.]